MFWTTEKADFHTVMLTSDAHQQYNLFWYKYMHGNLVLLSDQLYIAC